MSFPPLQKGLCVTLCVLCFCFIFLCGVIGDATVSIDDATVSIDDATLIPPIFDPIVVTVDDPTVSIGEKHIAETDENFVCATLDLWPPTKCNYGNCPWGRSSILNVDLNNKILRNAVKAFKPLRLRLGGTLQDRVVYQTKREEPCDSPFHNDTNKILDFTHACLSLDRWDEINSFIMETGAEAVFGLNALRGKTVKIEGIIDKEGRYLGETTTAHGDWDDSNSKSLIEYTLNKGYKIHGWTLGNELGGHTLFIGVPPEPYAKDTEKLHTLLEKIHKDVGSMPLIIAPGAVFDKEWYADYLKRMPAHLQVTTHHIYNLGGGDSENLKHTILTGSYLEDTKKTFETLKNILKETGTKAVAWVGESGGAYNSGQDGISNAFVYSFWYLNMLGLSATYDTKTYCRQTLIGGNYGLLGTDTFIPNPDYYSALLWHRLMGKTVLKTEFKAMENVYTYAHCAKKSATGITILVLNQDGQNPLKVSLDSTNYGTKREEYHLTPEDGMILSRKVKLNGKLLYVDPTGDIPALKPVEKETSKDPILEVAPHSIVFVHMPGAKLTACGVK